MGADPLLYLWMGSDKRQPYMSVWMAWKDWEFGQKKEPSRWLTLHAWQIIQRIENGVD